jgi:membrane associated rhomboid family serine protease
MGPDIINKQGESYFLNFYASALMAAVLVGTGIWIGWRRRKPSSEDIDFR